MTKPSARELHAQHEYEAAHERRLARVRAHEAEVRRLEDARWWRRVDPLMPVSRRIEDPDFPGCVL